MDYRLGRTQRYVLFLVGILLLVFCATAAMNGGLKGKGGVPVPPGVNIFALGFGAILGGAAIWRSCCPSMVVSTKLPPAPERVAHNQGNLEFQFLLRQDTARVILDEREDRIHFFNGHVPFGLRTSAAGGFSCTTNAIMRVHDARVANLGRCLTIVTRTGKCVAPRGDSDYSSLYQRLKLVVPENHPGCLIHDPRMQYPIGAAISGSGVLGLLAGCWMMPMGANDTMLYFFGALIATVVCIALSGWFGCQASLSARPVARLIGVVIAALMTSRGLTTVTFARARVTPV